MMFNNFLITIVTKSGYCDCEKYVSTVDQIDKVWDGDLNVVEQHALYQSLTNLFIQRYS